MPQSELDRLDPEGGIVSLRSGTRVQVVRLETRQFFRLLKVLTHGAGEALLKTSLDFSGDPSIFGQRLLMLILLSIPDAEAEAVDFIQSMVSPVGLSPVPTSGQRSKQQREDDAALFATLSREMFNPPLDDTITIIEKVIEQEAEDIQALGSRLSGLLNVFVKTGQPEEKTTPPTAEEVAASSAITPASSTSSPASTDGQTNGSSAPPSPGSGKLRTPSPAAATETSRSVSA